MITFDDLSDEERDVFNDALEIFSTGETYAALEGNTGLRDKLQMEFAEHCTSCYRKYDKHKSRF